MFVVAIDTINENSEVLVDKGADFWLDFRQMMRRQFGKKDLLSQKIEAAERTLRGLIPEVQEEMMRDDSRADATDDQR